MSTPPGPQGLQFRGRRIPPRLMLQMLVVLGGTDPLVWRRIRVPATSSFWDLHVAIQDAMGWQDRHLHEFEVLDPRSGTVLRLGIPDPDGGDDGRLVAGWTHFPLDYAVGSTPPMQYTYDMGDDWRHAVVFEGFEQSPGRGELTPGCVAGGGACPPEVAGGVRNYAELLAASRDASHPGHEEARGWLGEGFDPSTFAPADVRFDDPRKRWRIAFGGGD